MKIEDMQFLASIEAWVNKNPDKMHLVVNAAQSGLTQRLSDMHLRAVDMETVAAIALESKLLKTKYWYLVELLKKWAGKTSLNFDTLIKELEQKGGSKDGR